ncbi:HAD family hydrolase [Pseudothermotoga sp. U03pept]|uniref:HAD family hydrolase n=1 Tax=Pseudothermotoga sp. U03pept TaxID=3447012 RepID=UPI003F05A071
MVENIVFDLGRVLIQWDPYGYMLKVFGEPVATFLNKNVFETKEWNLLDKGEIEEEQLWQMMVERFPHYAEYIEHMKENVLRLLLPIEENIRFLPQLKAMGYKLYVLSNFGKNGFNYIHKTYDFFKYFNGMVISSHVNQIKPDPQIFTTLIDKYNVEPTKTLFIDDKAENIRTAQELGFKVIHLEDNSNLKDQLERLLGKKFSC